MDGFLWLVVLFFGAALIYAMAGFAGGSTYLALLVFFGLPIVEIPKVALVCNLIVATGGFFHHSRARNINWQKIWPFLLGSMPMAYFGGILPVSKTLFLILLGVSLVVAGGNLLLRSKDIEDVAIRNLRQTLQLALPVGLLLGFLSGLVGIGGGIFLAPVLYFTRWAKSREIAALTVVFILFNSVFGLAGQIVKSGFDVSWLLLVPLAMAVFFGGQIGAYLSAVRLPVMALRRVTAVLIIVAGLRAIGGVF